MGKIWKGFKAIFSSDPEKWPSWFRKYDNWMQRDGIWLMILLVFLMAMFLAKTIKDRIDLLEHRIRRIEEPLYKPRKDVALSCDMLNLEHIMIEENNTKTAKQLADYK